MLRWIMAGAALMACYAIRVADQPAVTISRPISVDYDLSFRTSLNEKVRLRLNASGTTGSPVRTVLTDYHNARIELETAAISDSGEPQFKTKISIAEKYENGTEGVIFRPQIRSMANQGARLAINENLVSVSVTFAKQDTQ